QDRFGRIIERNARLDLGDERHVGIVLMQLIQAQGTATQLVVAKERREIVSHCRDESLVNRDWNVVAEERRLERRGIISGPGAKGVGLHGIGEGGRQGKLMVLKFVVEL